MKDSVYLEETEKNYNTTAASNKLAVIVVTVSVILILILNLINTIFFY